MATSVPVPMATPRSAWASAGASLMPSPTIATIRALGLEPLDDGRPCRRAAPRRRRASRGCPTCTRDGLGRRAARRRSPARRSMPRAVQRADGLGGSGLDRIADGDQPGDATVDGDVGDACGRPRRLASCAAPSGAMSTPCSAISRALPTSTRAPPSTRGVRRRAGDRLEAGRPAGSRARRARARSRSPRRADARCPSRRRPRVAARSAGVEPGRRRRPSATVGRPRGQRAGLVEDDAVDPVRQLERLAAADQDARLGAAAGPDHDRRRRREAHRARAGDDEDADER